jgi:hypothetical protein
MALKTAMRCKEKLAGRSGAAAKSFDASMSKPFSRPFGIWSICLATALQALENRKVSGALAPCIQPDWHIPLPSE